MGWLVAEGHGPEIATGGEVGGDVCWMWEEWDRAMWVSGVVTRGGVGIGHVVQLAWDVVAWLAGGGEGGDGGDEASDGEDDGLKLHFGCGICWWNFVWMDCG